MQTANVFDKLVLPSKKITKFIDCDSFEEFIWKKKTIETLCAADSIENFKIRETDISVLNRQKFLEKIQAGVIEKEIKRLADAKPVVDINYFISREGKEYRFLFNRKL